MIYCFFFWKPCVFWQFSCPKIKASKIFGKAKGKDLQLHLPLNNASKATIWHPGLRSLKQYIFTSKITGQTLLLRVHRAQD